MAKEWEYWAIFVNTQQFKDACQSEFFMGKASNFHTNTKK
ncbi:hypothetical protein PATSB16_17030 [Pandoraea thiooxydans]|nr:hypothetical protein PATSB16_17030 [Pandoraea thiooxydans]